MGRAREGKGAAKENAGGEPPAWMDNHARAGLMTLQASIRPAAGLDNVPAGAYRLRIWHPGLPVTAELPAVPLTIGTADLTQTARLAVAGEP